MGFSMRKLILSLTIGVHSALSLAADAYFSIYLDGGKVGYSVTRDTPDLDAEGRRWSISETVFKSALMGTDLDMKMTSKTLVGKDGRPVSMEYVTESGGRAQTVQADFAGDTIKVVVDNGGTKSEKTLRIPPGAKVVDDATSALILEGPGAVKSFKVHVLDPTTITLIENEVEVGGACKVEVKGQQFDATLVTIKDPRAMTRIYYSSKGDVIKIEGALGMVMLPESKEEAMALEGGRTDLGESAAIRVTPNIARSLDTTRVSFRVTGGDLSRSPSDGYQTIKRTGANEWSVTIHPVDRATVPDISIASAGRYAQKWLKPTLHIPAGSPRFKSLSSSILKGEKNVIAGAERISRWIEANMNSNAGIGVLRDASEVLASKEGVCRDYAILGATLMRSAGIPTRVVSGLIYDNGQMYYHAWVEVWNGTRWIMFDPTRASMPTNALRFKLSHGNVEDAFTFSVLERCRFEVTSVKYR